MLKGFGQDTRHLKNWLRENNVWVVVSIYNEAAVLKNILPIFIDRFPHLVCVDDGSTDSTFEIISSFPLLHTIRHPFNFGQGAALRLGIHYALQHGAQYIVTMDADGQMNPDDVSPLLMPLLSNEADISIGTRFAKDNNQAHQIPPLRKWALRSCAFLLSHLFGMTLSDPQNGFRAMTQSAARRISIRQNRMGHAFEILWKIKITRMRFKEVPIEITYTSYSLHKGQKLSNVLNIFWDMVFSFAGPNLADI